MKITNLLTQTNVREEGKNLQSQPQTFHENLIQNRLITDITTSSKPSIGYTLLLIF